MNSPNRPPDEVKVSLGTRIVKTLMDAILWVLSIGADILTLRNWLNKRRRILDFHPRQDDIFLVTYPKSGTTWMQQILYQLTSEGEMDFEHISQKVPWLERSLLKGAHSKLRQLPSPRIFKTHLDYKMIPKTPGKYIYIARDGRDVAVSYYHQYLTLHQFSGNFNKFFSLFMKGKVQFGSWFKHIHYWNRNKRKLNVLYFTFEELKQDPEASVRRIAEFCGLPLDESRLKRVLERSSFAFMKEHESLFDHITESKLEKKQSEKGQFIRKGKSGGWKEYMDAPQQSKYTEQFNKWVRDTCVQFPES